MERNFILDEKGFAEMAVGPEIAAACLAEAARAKAIAEGLSADFIVSGEYIASFEVRSEIIHLPGDHGGRAHDVAAGILDNTSGHAVAVEYGFEGRSAHPSRSAHRVLGRTLAALGG